MTKVREGRTCTLWPFEIHHSLFNIRRFLEDPFFLVRQVASGDCG